VKPPSTGITAPEIQADASEAGKTANPSRHNLYHFVTTKLSALPFQTPLPPWRARAFETAGKQGVYESHKGAFLSLITHQQRRAGLSTAAQ